MTDTAGTCRLCSNLLLAGEPRVSWWETDGHANATDRGAVHLYCLAADNRPGGGSYEVLLDLFQAVTAALGIRNDQDPVIKAREIKARADRAPELLVRYDPE